MSPSFKRFLLGLSTLLFGISPLLRGQSYSLTTIAGKDRLGDGELALSVPLRYPAGIVQDANGVTYIADRDDNRVRRVANGTITTIAGTGRLGYTGDGGQATAATLNRPSDVKLDQAGNLYIADYNNLVIRKVTKAGLISTVVGNGSIVASGDNGPATSAGIDPFFMAFDTNGNLYVSDRLNHRIRKVTPEGTITTIAGIGVRGYSGDNGPATSAAISYPYGIAVDAENNVYFVDSGNYRVRKIAAATGTITTVAGSGVLGYSGDGNLATLARLYLPLVVAIEANGNIVIGSVYDIRKVIATTGIIQFVTGNNPDWGFLDGPTQTAIWGDISGLTVTPSGEILASDPSNGRVRRIANNIVSPYAGMGLANGNFATQTFLNYPNGLFIAGPGNLWIADRGSHQIRSIQPNGRIQKVFGDGYPTTGLNRVARPTSVTRDSQGFVYIAEEGNNRVLKIAPGNTSAAIFAGGGLLALGDGSASPLSTLTAPTSVAVDAGGVVYIADAGNCRVRRVGTNGIISTFAGGRCPYSGDGGAATAAGLTPLDIAFDGKGGLLITDTFNDRIRRVDISTGIITTIAGVGSSGFSGDGGPATSAQVDQPFGVAVDSAGRIFFSDYGNSRVRMIDANGVIRTIAGTGNFVSNADSGSALGVAFDPLRIAVDADGTLYVSDEYNDRIRKLTPTVPTTIQITQGNNGSGEPGDKITVQVKVVDAGGIPVANIPVNFKVTSGSATLSSVATNTTPSGVAQVQATLGSTLGPVVITATVEGVGSATINLEVKAAGPRLDDAQVVGAALSVPAIRAMSKGGIMSAFGKNFGVGAEFRKVGTADLVNGNVPTQFAGICVDISGTRALVFGASDTQVNFQVPALASGNAQVKVITGCGTAGEKSTNVLTVPVQAASPEFFYFVQSTNGKNPVAAIDSSTGAYLVSPSFFPGAAGLAEAKPGQTVTVFGTGFGDTNPSVAPGTFFGGGADVKGTVRVLLNGQELPAANVLYAGITPASPGLYQLNIKLPDTTPDGDLPLIIEIGGVQSSPGGFLAVKR